MTTVEKPQSSPAQETVLELIGISKHYPGVTALKDVDMTIRRGEIHALLGENGAGKSTLIGVISGTVSPDEGELRIGGDDVRLHGPLDARQRGISVVPQDLLFVPELSIGRNILLGLEHGRINRRDRLSPVEREKVKRALDQVGADFPPSVRAGNLTTPELRLAQVARALVDTGDVVVLDEPTAVLSESDAEHLLERLMDLRDAGKAIVYVSHRLGEITRMADRVTVLRDGSVVGRFSGELDREKIIATMGRGEAKPELQVEWNAHREELLSGGPAAVKVNSVVVSPHAEPIDLEVGKGEIAAIVGVQGSGHEKLAWAITGAAAPLSGLVEISGKTLPPGNIRAAIAEGVLLVPADRRREAMVAPLSIASNMAISGRIRSSTRRLGFRRLGAERAVAGEYIDKLNIRAPGPQTLTRNLSGGNQQKVALSRAMESSPTVLVVAEPTQGIDIRAKEEIRRMLAELAQSSNCAVIIATSEFDDVLGLADRVHVMCLGSLVASLDGRGLTYNEILAHALP